MSYKFQGARYNTSRDALEAIAVAWVYGGAKRPYHETLEEAPAKLAAACVQAWGLRALLAEMGENEAALAGAMERVVAEAPRLPKPVKRSFADLLRAAGVTRPWLARQVGRSRGAIDRWCDGRVRPPAAVVEWLRERIDNPPPRLD